MFTRTSISAFGLRSGAGAAVPGADCKGLQTAVYASGGDRSSGASRGTRHVAPTGSRQHLERLAQQSGRKRDDDGVVSDERPDDVERVVSSHRLVLGDVHDYARFESAYVKACCWSSRSEASNWRYSARCFAVGRRSSQAGAVSTWACATWIQSHTRA